MKYLKKFNEELNPVTYKRAANKLDKKGHVYRATQLRDWGNQKETELENKKWLDSIEEMKKFGTFKLKIEVDGKEFIADFYLNLVLDREGFADTLAYLQEQENSDWSVLSFWFSAIIIPVDEEVKQKCFEIMPEPDFMNGGFWGISINIPLVYDQHSVSLKIENFSIDNYDNSMSGNISIADRRSANKLRKLMIDIFSDENLNYPSGYNDFSDIWELLNGYFSTGLGLNVDYGWYPEQVADYFKEKTVVNDFYKN